MTYQLQAIFGAPGSGKTTLVDELVWRYRHTHPQAEVTIIDPNAAFPGEGTWPADADVAGWLVGYKARRAVMQPYPPSGLLVLDDADRYLAGGPPTGIWRDLFTSFRHWRVNILLNARRTQDIPKVVIASCSKLYVFRHREVYGIDYLARMQGEEIRANIPREPYHYLEIDVDSGKMRRGKTRRRHVILPSDGDVGPDTDA